MDGAALDEGGDVVAALEDGDDAAAAHALGPVDEAPREVRVVGRVEAAEVDGVALVGVEARREDEEVRAEGVEGLDDAGHGDGVAPVGRHGLLERHGDVEDVEDEVVEYMIQEIDLNGDGKIDLMEFL